MRRRAIPDNLDPLVDTLANVVGILVIVLALTQIELGGALERVLRLEAAQDEEARAGAAALPAALEQPRAALAERGVGAGPLDTALADEILEALASLGEHDRDSPERIEAQLAELSELRRANAAAERALEAARARAAALASVPKELVARLPDPQVEFGRVSWLLVRYGRIFPVDREGLYEEGRRALHRLLGESVVSGAFRPDEYESAALYLRKRRIGRDGFHWELRTQPQVRVELDWPPPEQGIDPLLLERDPRWHQWLSRQEPGEHFVRFHVWNDSFETYLIARQAVEAAGLGAGWVGHEADDEIRVPLSLGPPAPREREIEID